MMGNTMDMSAPVTRGELREELDRAFEQRLAPLATKAELAQFATKADLEPLATKAELAQFATKADLEPLVTKEYLEERLKPLVTKEYLEERLKPMASKEDLYTWGGALLEEIKKRIREEMRTGMDDIKSGLRAEFAVHVKTMEETFRKQVSTFDDKYKDLPERVNRLEGAVFSNDKPPTKLDDTKARSEEEQAKARRSTRSSKPARSPKRR